MSLAKFTSAFKFPKEVFLLLCEEIIQLFNEEEANTEHWPIFDFESIEICNFNPEKPDELDLKIIDEYPTLTNSPV